MGAVVLDFSASLHRTQRNWLHYSGNHRRFWQIKFNNRKKKLSSMKILTLRANFEGPMKMQFWGGKHFLNVEKNISLDLKLSTVANILYSSIGYYYYWKTHKKFKRSKLKKIIWDRAKKEKEFRCFVILPQ